MEKQKYFNNIKFPVQTIQEAVDLQLSIIGGKQNFSDTRFKLNINNEGWYLDSIEEFFADYNKSHSCYLRIWSQGKKKVDLDLYVFSGKDTQINVSSADRKDIEAIFQIFENNVEGSRIVVEKDPIKVFIGHGNDQQWRLLKDHLQDSHSIEVVAYEIGPRAGLSVKEVLEEMLNKSSIAFLVLTGEDITNYGELYARQNVVHELGLFQGKLGFKKAIALLEEGVTEFSNIYGVNQIRFSNGNIRETFGDVVATIKREFD